MPRGGALEPALIIRKKSTHLKASYVFRGEWGCSAGEGTSPSPWKVEGSPPDSLSRGIYFPRRFQRRSWRGQQMELSLAVLPQKELKTPELLHVGAA